MTLQTVDEKIVLTCEHDEGGRSDVRHPSMTRSPTRNNQRRMETQGAYESRLDVAGENSELIFLSLWLREH